MKKISGWDLVTITYCLYETNVVRDLLKNDGTFI